MKTAGKSNRNWMSYQGIASKIFSMLNLLLQAIASISNVALRKYLEYYIRLAMCARGLSYQYYESCKLQRWMREPSRRKIMLVAQTMEEVIASPDYNT